MNGGLLRLLDFFPGTKTYGLASLMVLAGLGGCAACIVRYVNGEADPWISWAAAGGMLELGLTQITNRLALDRANAAQINATANAAIITAAGNSKMPQTTHDAKVAMAEIEAAATAVSTPVPTETEGGLK